MRKSLVATLILGLAVCASSNATTLVNLTNPPGTTGTSYSLSFVAGAGITDISFAGYQSPARLWAEDISLTTGGGGNLLGLTWTFTPFNPLDTTDAGQFNDGYGTGTNGLHLENGTGDLDRFDQIVNTVPGQMYTLDFLFINTANPNNAPSELLVSATAVPEPSSLALMLTIAVGFACSRLLKARVVELR